jgi:hypothetical protein
VRWKRVIPEGRVVFKTILIWAPYEGLPGCRSLLESLAEATPTLFDPILFFLGLASRPALVRSLTPTVSTRRSSKKIGRSL